jgi:Zn-dependent protease/CBS domain-containing protein
MRNGLRLGSIAGIDILVDWSLLIIFALILFSLGAGVFAAWHPDWGLGLTWSTALIAALLFFASVLLHELAHALVGRLQGAEVPRITLFVFGGMAQMEREPAAWKGELVMAAVGPFTSLVIGVVCLLAVGALSGPLVLDPDDPMAFFARLGPLATLLLWLGQINILLGLFNLVPGFPLDGGRVLRAVLWGATGDQRKATRWAAGLGQGVAWLLIAGGILLALGRGVLGGLWLALIGWFLNNAAVASYRQLVVTQSLASVSVRRVLQTGIETIAPDMRLSALVEKRLLHTSQRVFPVMRGDEFLGLVCLEDLRRVPPSERARAVVRDIMTPRDRLVGLTLADSAEEALRRLSSTGVNQLPVLQDGRLQGLVTREALLRYLALEASEPVDGAGLVPR